MWSFQIKTPNFQIKESPNIMSRTDAQKQLSPLFNKRDVMQFKTLKPLLSMII